MVEAAGKGRISSKSADAIDFAGAIGVLREFSTKPRDLRKSFESARKRMEKNKEVIKLAKSKELFEIRIKRAERLPAKFEEESFGSF